MPRRAPGCHLLGTITTAVSLAVGLVAVGLVALPAGVAHADDARITFSGSVTPDALGGHIGLDALGGNGAKLCLAGDNPTGCPGGYTSVIAWNAAGQLPLSGFTLPIGTTTAHLELYPRTRYNDFQSNDPWNGPTGGSHVWVRDLQPGQQVDVGSIPLPAPGDGAAVQMTGAIAATTTVPDGRIKVNAYQITGLHHTSTGIEAGAFVESFSRGNQWTLGWAWPGQYVAYLTDQTTGVSIEGFFTVTTQAPTLDLDAVCFGLDACQYQSGSAPPTVGTLHPLSPARLLDTRDGTGRPAGPVGPGDGRSTSASSIVRAGEAVNHELQVVGRGGVPATGVSAVLLNVTAVSPTDAGYLTVYPKLARGARNPTNLDEVWDDQSSYIPGYPNSSNINFAAGDIIPNLVLAPVGAGGKVRLDNFAGTVDVVVDVVGWFDTGPPTGDGFVPVTPGRLLDTRNGTGGIGGRFSSGDRRDLIVAGRLGVPADASAVVVNVTAVDPGSAGFVTVWPSGAAMPLASSLNTSPGRTRPNLVVAKIGTGGAISLYDYADFGGTDLVVDVVGFFAAGGGAVAAVQPQRLLDTRSGLDTTLGPFASDESRDVQVTGHAGVPADATAVVLNLTATEPTQAGFVTAWPAGQARPLASTLDFQPGDNVANLVMVGLGPGGVLSLYQFGGSTQVVADVVGYVTS